MISAGLLSAAWALALALPCHGFLPGFASTAGKPLAAVALEARPSARAATADDMGVAGGVAGGGGQQRRDFFATAAVAAFGGAAFASSSALLLAVPGAAQARSPGSSDVAASLAQIEGARTALRGLQANWKDYAVIDAEGRAGDVDRARRILGGVAPQNGAGATDLYKVEGALKAVQRAANEAPEGAPLSNLDVEEFSEVSERIAFQLQKADFSFYSCAFAPGGTRQVAGLYEQAKEFVDRSVNDFDKISKLIAEAS